MATNALRQKASPPSLQGRCPSLEEPPLFLGSQACLKVGTEETYRAVLRVLRKRLVRLPTVDPAPDQVADAFLYVS